MTPGQEPFARFFKELDRRKAVGAIVGVIIAVLGDLVLKYDKAKQS